MKVIYPGSFDPVTNGHLDIIERAAKIFDKVIVAVAVNQEKNPLFSVPERVEMLREASGHLANVEVDYFRGLLVDYVEQQDAAVVIRSLRAVSDFEYELQMAMANKRLNENVEMLFMMTSAEYSFLSSSHVRELAEFNAPLTGLVPNGVGDRITEKLKEKRREAGSK